MAAIWKTRALAMVGAIVAATAVAATPAVACGGLVGENGTIQLVKTTTLAAYHDGIERYVTSFEFQGQGKEVGSIVPLPGVPTSVVRGGSWTLQRLEREVNPQPPDLQREVFASAAKDSAQVILQTQVDALDITVLRGGGNAVGKWAIDHGFLLTPDAPAVLDFYAKRSPIFMTARFDAQRARQLGQNQGDGTPIMVTIPTKEPWVPLRILALGLASTKVVDADVFLLTDTRPKLLAGGSGLSLGRDEAASVSLLDDLRSDKNMGWVPQSMWLTYLPLHVQARDLDYDLAIAAHPGVLPSLRDAGVSVAQARAVELPHHRALWPWVIGSGFAAMTFMFLSRRRRHRAITERVPV
jgi:hypothetical protein